MLEIVRAFDEVEVTGRTLEGPAVAWDTPYRVTDDRGASFYLEGWRRRAFVAGIEMRRNVFELRDEHADVRAGLVSFTETGEGLIFRAVADETDIGDQVLEDVRTGRRRGVSLRARPERQKRDSRGVIWRTRALLRELSVTRTPQYAGAGVAVVRSAPAQDPDWVARQRAISEILAWDPTVG